MFLCKENVPIRLTQSLQAIDPINADEAAIGSVVGCILADGDMGAAEIHSGGPF